MKKITITILAVFMYLLVTQCEYTRLAMPNSDDTSIIYNTGEIKYMQISPTWTDFNSPIDIFISLDDYIFVADSGNQEVIVLKKTGEQITSDESGNDFSALSNLEFRPVGLCIDSKLNVFMVDKSNKIYDWNQFTNNCSNTGDDNDSIAVEITYRNTTSGELVTVTDFSESEALEGDGYIIDDVTYEYDQTKIDSILGVHVFYEEPEANSSRFVSVGKAPSSKSAIYATDAGEQKIVKIEYERSAYLKLADGTTLWQHRGIKGKAIATAGTGSGTINDPTGIFVDDAGDVYYTQTGINFGFHKIEEYNEDEELWSSAFTLGVNEIMDLERFVDPADVAVDDDGAVFVLNTGENEVQIFDDGGEFVRKAGLRSVQVDTTISTIVDGVTVEKDTIITKYYNDILNNPRGIFVDDDVVYIVNSGDNSIVRFMLSTDIDVDLEE